MNKHMVEETGSRFFELASSLGRIHADTLSGLADATSKTPFGAVFAVNASLARMANEGMETMASRLTVATPKVAGAPVPASAPAPAPKPKKKKAKKPAPFAVEVAPAVEAIEPDIADVLIDDVIAEDVLVEDVVAATPVTADIPDDLTQISGIGATTAKKLNGAGVEKFVQIAVMDEAAFADLLTSLDIKSIRFSPAFWIEEAKKLSA